jgi:hypothetical protein
MGIEEIFQVGLLPFTANPKEEKKITEGQDSKLRN